MIKHSCRTKKPVYLHLYLSSRCPLHNKSIPTLNDKTLIFPLLALKKKIFAWLYIISAKFLDKEKTKKLSHTKTENSD